MNILRAKTNNLFSYQSLTEKQKKNQKLNNLEMTTAETALRSIPQRLVLELTNTCNLSCIMCGRHAKEFKPTFFKVEWLDKFAPIMEQVSEVTLFGWGEPTVHPEFRQILGYLTQYPVKKYFLTNGMLLNHFIDPVINTVDILAISLDGATPATNNRIRRGADFNQIINNIKCLVAKRRSLPLKQPHINLVMTLMKDNLRELPLMVELANDLGIEEVKAVYLTAFSDELAPQVLFNQQDEVKKVFAETLTLAQKHDILVKLPYIQGEDPAHDTPHKPCFVGWRDLFLGSDGFIRPCQSTSHKFFNIQNYSDFSHLWNSSEYKTFRKSVNKIETMPTQCENCYQSSFANWNKRSSFLQNEISSNFSPEWQLNKQQ